MAKPPRISQDERFHHEIWTGPSEAFIEQNPSIQYVENHNADWDYGLAADDYKLAADALIAEQKRDPLLGNWTAPICHLIRQTLELQIKSLLQTINWRVNGSMDGFTFTHDIDSMWKYGREWLIDNEYHISNDARLPFADRLIANLHAIDPAGDLFRFGTSRQQAFGRAKTYDRVGIVQELLFDEFEFAYMCIDHWTSVLLREIIAREEGWTEDPYFDAANYPKVSV